RRRKLLRCAVQALRLRRYAASRGGGPALERRARELRRRTELVDRAARRRVRDAEQLVDVHAERVDRIDHGIGLTGRPGGATAFGPAEARLEHAMRRVAALGVDGRRAGRRALHVDAGRAELPAGAL